MDIPPFEMLKVHVVAGIAELTLSRPKALNALNRQLLGELDVALERLAADPSLRCAIVTGDGEKAFVAGADIAEMSSLSTLAAEASWRSAIVCCASSRSSPCRCSPRSTASLWAAAASWRSPATSYTRATARASVSPR